MRKKKQSIQIPHLEQKISINSKKLDEKQLRFLAKALDKKTKVMFIDGPAGSAKTYMSVYSGLRLLSAYDKLDLLYVRTVIESAEKGMGALPGDVEEKFNPYMVPLLDKLEEMLPQNNTLKRDLLEKGRISSMPINFLRGATWRDKVVIADEAQNFTLKELTTLITRIGENTKLFVCGDSMQSDINGKSGFQNMCHIFNDSVSRQKGIECFNFDASDIKRSSILKFIIEKLQDYNKKCSR